jgi:hypothetical protein
MKGSFVVMGGITIDHSGTKKKEGSGPECGLMAPFRSQKGKYGPLDPNLRAQLDEQPEKRLKTKESCEGRRG